MDFSSYKTHAQRIASSLLMLTVIAFSYANSAHAKDTTALDELLSLSGMLDSLGEVGNQFKTGVAQASANNPQEGEMDKVFYALADKHLSGDNLNSKMRAAMAEQLNDKVIQESLVWYRSDLAKSITQAEEAAGSAAAQQQMMQSVPTLMADEARVAYENRVLAMLNITEMMVTMQQEIMLGLVENMAAVEGNGEAIDITPIKQQVLANRPVMKAQVEQYMLVFLLFAHREFSMEQLAQYETYLKSDSGRAYSTASMKAMNSVLTSAMADLGKEMRTKMSALKKTEPAA